MSSSFYGIKSRYNNAVRRYELLKVATSYENSKICNTDLAVISNITVLLKQIENFQGMIKNANVVCENKEFSNHGIIFDFADCRCTERRNQG